MLKNYFPSQEKKLKKEERVELFEKLAWVDLYWPLLVSLTVDKVKVRPMFRAHSNYNPRLHWVPVELLRPRRG
jgi:hypothetical protein